MNTKGKYGLTGVGLALRDFCPNYRLLIWDALMHEDESNFGTLLDISYVHEEDEPLYDIVLNWQRFECMRVLLMRLPLEYLKLRYKLHVKKVWRDYIRSEALRRSYLTLSLQVCKVPDDVISIVWSYIR